MNISLFDIQPQQFEMPVSITGESSTTPGFSVVMEQVTHQDKIAQMDYALANHTGPFVNLSDQQAVGLAVPPIPGMSPQSVDIKAQVVELKQLFNAEMVSDIPPNSSVEGSLAATRSFVAAQRFESDPDALVDTELTRIGADRFYSPQAETGDLPSLNTDLAINSAQRSSTTVTPEDSKADLLPVVPIDQNQGRILPVEGKILPPQNILEASLKQQLAAAEQKQNVIPSVQVKQMSNSQTESLAASNGDAKAQSVIATSNPMLANVSVTTFAVKLSLDENPDNRMPLNYSVSTPGSVVLPVAEVKNSANRIMPRVASTSIESGLGKEAISDNIAGSASSSLKQSTTSYPEQKIVTEAVGLPATNVEFDTDILTQRPGSQINTTVNTEMQSTGPTHHIIGVSNPTAQNSILQPVEPAPISLSLPRAGAEMAEGLGDRVGWMINQKLNTAVIRLDPPALGKLDIHIQLKDDITTITINTQHAQTRDLIENASFRLRDILQDSGYQNVNVDVSHREDQQQAKSQSTSEELDDADVLSEVSEDSTLQPQQQHSQSLTSAALVDYFA